LQTDHLDLIQLHDFHFPQLRDEELLTAVERLKRDGKVRFFGVTTHNIAGDMRSVDAAVNCELVDTILTWINPLTTGYQEMLKKAKAKDLGVIAMKAAGALKRPYWENYEKYPEYRRRLQEFDQQRGDLNLYQCAIAWALEQEGVSMALVGFENFQQIEEDVKVSGVKLTAQQRTAFERLAEAASPQVCRWCRACEGDCPQGLPIADILRYRRYAESYGRARAEQAGRLYAQLPAHPDFAACAHCRACERACPYGLTTVAQLQRAHEVLA
jgi:predicted aldo/keto reductase-like oxidoreductase